MSRPVLFYITAVVQRHAFSACLVRMKIANCIAFFILLLCSCSVRHFVYSPSATNTAMSSEAGDGHVDAYASVSGGGLGVNVMGNYAIGKFFGIGAQYYYTGDENSGQDTYIGPQPATHSNLNYTRRLALAHAYFYMPFNNSKTFYGELSVGYGAGKYYMKDRQSTNQTSPPPPTPASPQTFEHTIKAGHTTAHAALYGIAGKQRNIKLGGAMRFSNIKFRDRNTTYSQSQLASYSLDSLTLKATNFLDPSLSFRYIFPSTPNLEITAQAGIAIRLNGPYFSYRSNHFSLGVGYAFGRKKEK